jgi:hypothetical protein
LTVINTEKAVNVLCGKEVAIGDKIYCSVCVSE